MTMTTTRAAGDRVDARSKATGVTRYAADFRVEGTLHAAVVRSPVPHGEIASISTTEASAMAGVVAVVTSSDLPAGLCGRKVRDMPLLAREKVRFSGENVAVVLAETRDAAEAAAALVDVDYRDLPAMLQATGALHPDAPIVHATPWDYEGAVVTAGSPPNLQSELCEGSEALVADAIGRASHLVARTYRTPPGHQGYLEPHCWTAVPSKAGGARLLGTTKSPYRLREQIAKTLDLDVATVEIEPVPLGGDFGGKGDVVDASLCVALALRAGRPVRLALRSGEDLTSTDARHSSQIEVRIGCDEQGRLLGLSVDALLDGGAYAAAKPIPSVNLHGIAECALGYRLPCYAVRSRIVYTNTVPKGHMRAPGAPQAVFAIESAIDELAEAAGIDPVALRKRNLLADGDRDAYGHLWPEARGMETVDAAIGQPTTVEVPPGWREGRGLAVYARPTAAPSTTSLRLMRHPDDRFEVQVPIPETGTGSHTVVRERLAAALDVASESIDVVQVGTGDLPYDPGVGASRVTVGVIAAVDQLVAAWEDQNGDGPVTVQTAAGSDTPALSYCAQVAHVAVDLETGQVRVLELTTAVDVAAIVRPRAHQLQIDGGAVMGLGFACLEDLLESEGQVWAANLGEFRLPTAGDIPVLHTVLIEGGRGVGPADLKAVGELANVPVAPAVVNGIADAIGCRMRALPVTAERVYWALRAGEQS